MSIRDIGKAATDILKPDGTSVLATAGQFSTILQGTVSNITGLVQGKATDKIKNGVSSVIGNPNFVQTTGAKNLPALFPNPLEEFASYSVLWTMSCLEPHQFNNPKSYRNSPADLKHIVFASAGRYDSQRTKTYYGVPEYYVNNFVMTCIIGANEKTGNSNAVKFSFDIIEPYSMGLLLQSMQAAAINAGYLDYLNNAPYVLRMDIQGYDEVGRIITSVKPKYFTLKLSGVKFSVNEGGSTYKVEAIPYNHQGFSDTINTSYNDLKISGDPGGPGTVAELLNNGQNSLTAVLNRNEKKLVDEGRIGKPDVYEIQFPELAEDWFSTEGTPPKNNKATKDPNVAEPKPITGGAQPNKEKFKDNTKNEIGAASLGFTQLSGGNPLFKRANDQYDEKTGVVKRDNMTIDPKQRAFQFGQGQSLTAMINQIVLSSDFAKKTIEKTTPEGYIKWFKLDVQIELKDPDPITGDYSKKITFRVVPYYIHQSIFANPSSAPVGYAELMKQITKEYQYIYTGQNVDVLKFDIQINNLFYSGIAPSPENEGAQTSNQDQKGVGPKANLTTQTGQGAAPAAQAAQAGRARPKRDPKLLEGYKGGSGEKSTEQNVAETFQAAFLSGNSADLVTVDLEILGDPYWLVDSGMGNYFAGATSPNKQVNNDGTMNYESGNVYIYLTFRTPADINETTGLYDFSVAGKESPFGGIYRIVQCENTFADGMWKQKLKCLRMPGPQGPEATNKTSGNEKLPISKQDNNAVTFGKTENLPTSPIQDVTKTTPPPTETPAVPRYIAMRESVKLQQAYIAKLDAYKVDKTEANWAAYQAAKTAADNYDAANNL